MRVCISRLVALAATVGAVAAAGEGTAHASPSAPVVPFIPGPPSVPYPGASSYAPYFQLTLAPATTDTRGVRTGGLTGDPSMTSVLMPGSKPGNAFPNLVQQYTSANARYGIQGGTAPPQGAAVGLLPGMVAGAGPAPIGLENPGGQSPQSGAGTPSEVHDPAPPTYPQLEAPSGGAEHH